MNWNQKIVKANNKQAILDTILDQAPISRAEISQRLGLTKGTVSSLVSELLEAELCTESGPGESSGGRRPVMLLFHEKAGYSIGMDVGVHYTLGILTDLNGEIIKEKRIHTDNTDFDHALHIMKEIISFLIKEAPESHYGVIGIGMGIPGMVNTDDEILFAPNLSWKNRHLKKEIEKEFNLPVVLENEANAGAYGEKKFGAGKESANLIYVSVGIGIGVGVLINNELYRGARGFSGEMGHMVIETDGKPCKCGSNGCWELYASEKALLDRSQELLEVKGQTLEELIDQAKDNKTHHLFEEIGHYIGIGISNIANTFNPEQIIIGNRLALAKEWIEGPVAETVNERTLPYNQQELQISFAELSIYSAALGTAAHAIEYFLRNNLKEHEE